MKQTKPNAWAIDSAMMIVSETGELNAVVEKNKELVCYPVDGIAIMRGVPKPFILEDENGKIRYHNLICKDDQPEDEQPIEEADQTEENYEVEEPEPSSGYAAWCFLIGVFVWFLWILWTIFMFALNKLLTS